MRSFHLLTCLLACLALPALGDEETPPTSSDPPGDASPAVTDDPGPLPRVIIYPSRLRSIAGHVLSETPGKIKIRTLNDQVQEFDTSLIFSLVRLHDVAAPAQAVVLLHDGRRREGLLEEDAFDHVTLRIHEVPHEFKREDVAFVQLLPSFQEQYEWLQQQLDEDDPAAHLKLCEWLVKRDRLTEAKTELEALIKTHDYELGRRLLRRVNAPDRT